MAHYLDTSAIVKLVIAEPESGPLRRWLGADGRRLLTSDLARTELIRAVRRDAPDLVDRALDVLDVLEVHTISRGVYEAAGRLDPILLRSLDAIHLACALDLGEDLESVVTYDRRLSDAALAYQLAVSAPA